MRVEQVLCVVMYVSVMGFLGCSNPKNLEGDIVSSGGLRVGNVLCPQSANDVIVPLEKLALAAEDGAPEMTMEGVEKFINDNEIATIPQFLNRLPEHYRTNFSLVEVTRGEGQSNLHFPRIVLFGSDGRFLMNVSTKPEDPKYDLLDCAELDEETGAWEFSQLDFTSAAAHAARRPNQP